MWSLSASHSSFPDWATTLPACCRAWRRIEDHIGTKTAVQIRSHAQKFFSKLEKEQAAGAKGAAHLCSTKCAACAASPAYLLLVEGEQALLPICIPCSVEACCLQHIIEWGALLGMTLLILLTHLHTLGCRPGRPEHPPSAPQAQALAPLPAQGVGAHRVAAPAQPAARTERHNLDYEATHLSRPGKHCQLGRPIVRPGVRYVTTRLVVQWQLSAPEPRKGGWRVGTAGWQGSTLIDCANCVP